MKLIPPEGNFLPPGETNKLSWGAESVCPSPLLFKQDKCYDCPREQVSKNTLMVMVMVMEESDANPDSNNTFCMNKRPPRLEDVCNEASSSDRSDESTPTRNLRQRIHPGPATEDLCRRSEDMICVPAPLHSTWRM